MKRRPGGIGCARNAERQIEGMKLAPPLIDAAAMIVAARDQRADLVAPDKADLLIPVALIEQSTLARLWGSTVPCDRPGVAGP